MYSLKQTIRQLLKNKAFAVINIFSLVIGITSFLILFVHVLNEKSFDKHFSGHENIYRVVSVPGGRDNALWARSLGIIHEASANIPGVELATQFSHCDIGTIKIGDDQFQQKNIMSVDDAFIKMFEVKAVIGNLSDINKPNTVFISEDFARKHYGNLNPIGQTIKVEALQYLRDLGDYEIRGIVKNTHPKTHFKYELLLAQKGSLSKRYAQLPYQKIQWTYNYFKLRKGVAPALVAQKIEGFYDKSSLKTARGPQEYNFSLFPMDDIHLKSNFRFELRDSSSKINIGLFVLISFIILAVSLLNFTNLTIVKLVRQSKELGLRRSIGASKTQLTMQVLTSVLLLCSVAVVISLLTIEAIKPFINQLFDIDFELYYTEPIVYLSIAAVLATCLGLTAIFVMIFLVSQNSTIDILAKRNNFSGNHLMKTLLVIQVTIVIILISGTLLVNKQINYVLNRPLGFDKENVVVLHLKDLSKAPEVFVQELERQPQVVSVGMAYQYFGYPAQEIPLSSFGIDGTAEFVFANYDYLKTMHIKLIRNWINPDVDTIRGLVINNHLYKRLMEKYKSTDALFAYLAKQPLESGQMRIKLAGVTEDFNYNSAHESIGDFAFWLDESRNRARFVHVRMTPGSLHAGMNTIKKIWQANYPQQGMEYFFVDDKIARQYKSETILRRILFVFSTIGILISITGSSALALFISQQRTKEIGIRKVNGAKVSEVMTMLNKDFIKWVGIAFAIATPIAWLAMNKWLENFAYKTNLSWWIFALAGILALGIALLTVSWQSWKAATRNPVEALRYE